MKILVLATHGNGYKQLAVDCGFSVVDDIKDADVVMFTGGEDISPSLYGEKPWPETGAANVFRDTKEKLMFQHCVENNKPMIGICRGAQLLCALSGGKLHQHVTGHGRTHSVCTDQGEEFQVTSTHHQMMIPWIDEVDEYDQPFEILAYTVGLAFDGLMEPEVVWCEETQSLCFQYHPEYMPEDSEGRKYFISLVKEYIFK